MRLFSKRYLLLASCGLAISAAPAYAQEAAEAVESNDNVILVTAQNRAQNVQDVPIVMDVIGAEEIADSGFTNANDLDAIAPAVQINQDQGVVKITVRGVGTTSNDEAQDTSVVANVDGEYINRPNVLSVALFDLERVEVLRGPQGTLYGRNATGGAINFIARKPSLELGANASVSYGNYNDVQLQAGVEAPIGDTAGVRVFGFYNDRDGYVDHPAGYGFGPFPVFVGGSSDDNNSYGGRVSFRIDDPDNNFEFNLAAEYAKRKFTPQAFAFNDLNSGSGPAGPGCNAGGFTEIGAGGFPNVSLCVPDQTNFLGDLDRGEYASPGFGLGQIEQDTWALRGRFSYEFSPSALLTYTGGYRHFAAGENDFVTLPVAYRSFSFKDIADTQSHELRLNGEVFGGVVYQVGGFYFKETLDRENGFFLPIGPNGTFLSYFGRDIESESSSLFGQVDVPVTETVTLVGGLRYTDNSREAVYLNASPFGAGPPDGALFNAGPSRKNFDDFAFLSTVNLASSEDKVTWLLGVNYKPNPDTLIYAKASTGFKGGGFDAVGTYLPETNTAYEAGAKLNLGDSGQHLLNLGGFFYDYKDLQVSVLLDTTVGGQIFNAGAATIWGLEAEGSFEVVEGGIFSFSVNYLNAQYDELLGEYNLFCVDNNAGNAVDDCDGINGVPGGDLDPSTAEIDAPNFAGNSTPFSPEFIITAGYSHSFDMGSSGTITAGVNTVFKDSYFTDFFNYSDGQQDSFTKTDLTLQWSPQSEMFKVLLFAKNLEDERSLTYGSFVSAGPDDIFNWQFGAPRTYGVRVSFYY